MTAYKPRGYSADDVDTYIVAAMLAGNLRYWDAMLGDMEADEIGDDRFTDRRLLSLCETLLNWRKHTICGEHGTLKGWVPRMADTYVSGNAIRSAIGDMLLAAGMWGKPYTYGEGDDTQTFEGWTLPEMEEIANLYRMPEKVAA